MSPKTNTLYECGNTEACTLGTRGTPGLFTSGITAEQVSLVTGKPVDTLKDGVDYGEGVCPNCGTKGKPVKIGGDT